MIKTNFHTGRKVKRSKESRSVAFSKMLRNLNLLNTNTFPYFLINRLIFTDNPLFIYLLQQIERLIKRVVTILHDQMKFTLYFAITTMPDCLADNDRWCIIFYYTGCPKKNARSWHFGYNSTLEMARNKGRVCFEKFWKFSIWYTQKFFNLTY